MKILSILFCGAIFGLSHLSNQDDKLGKSIQRGKVIYAETCISCHMGDGRGVSGSFPPLAKSDFLVKTPERAISAIKFGLQGKIQVNGTEYNNVMPNPGLANDEIADVMNYIRNLWGNTSNKKMITEEMVDALKELK
ncbi:MAG TPA: cytochrome c [Pedobacter sp.]|uniref:c-type cytochrome n=1 Tax=Pedobacter sp. TaxID=1411316 RepID=UPI002BA0D633|nr:cytochrome c [Pedobacter sp.]HMI05230.1 cytochrome c [Pedobacter sp.]